MNPPRPHSRHRRGFAMLTAIALIALVGVAMAAAGAVFRLDLRRTAAVVEDAQLRQLLLAGERAARQKLPASGAVAEAVQPVPLPAALASRGGGVAVRFETAQKEGEATATVEASLEGRLTRQTLHYERGPDGWRLVSAELRAPPTESGSGRD